MAIKTERLTKKFGKFTAVNSLNLNIEEGEIYGLLGPNGSGKTTVIKILNGLLLPTSGKAWVLGRPVPPRGAMQRIGYMPQESSVYPDNTVHENLLLFGEIYSLPRERILKRERQLLRFVDLQDWRDALVSTLSGGMRHRLSLACSLIHEPRLLFLDEPTVGVDPELRAAFWEYFKALRDMRTTLIITTHYIDEAIHCTEVGLLRQGKLIAEGRPDMLMGIAGTDTLEDAFLVFVKGERK